MFQICPIHNYAALLMRSTILQPGRLLKLMSHSSMPRSCCYFYYQLVKFSQVNFFQLKGLVFLLLLVIYIPFYALLTIKLISKAASLYVCRSFNYHCVESPSMSLVSRKHRVRYWYCLVWNFVCKHFSCCSHSFGFVSGFRRDLNGKQLTTVNASHFHQEFNYKPLLSRQKLLVSIP